MGNVDNGASIVLRECLSLSLSVVCVQLFVCLTERKTRWDCFVLSSVVGRRSSVVGLCPNKVSHTFRVHCRVVRANA